MKLVLSRSLKVALQKRLFSTTPSRFGNQYKVRLPLFAPGFEERFRNKVAFTDWQDRHFTYEQLTGKSLAVNNELKTAFKRDDKTRVSFLCPNDSSFLTALWGIWMAGHTGVPLSSKHPDNLLEYFIKSSKSDIVVTTKEFADRLNPVTRAVGSELVVLDFEQLKQSELDKSYLNNNNYVGDKDALILFTSGTTGLPKGVLLTHENLHAQIDNICTAWEINHNDSLLHTLPLHHTHGLIHALLSPLAVGGRVHMMAKFDAATLWSHLLSSDPVRVNLLMGVPTVYVKLVEEYEKTYGKKARIEQEFVKATCEQKMRMMLSGSAALPIPVLEKFKVITGHTLLERYGMTEIGMALTNPLHGERKPGYVGNPFESVRVRIADLKSRTEYKTLAEGTKNRTDILEGKKDKVIGDLLVKGPSVFKCYFNNPEATAKEFTHDGWFITGDTVEYSQGSYKILGRKSVDIIKSGGYKLSALEIETQLLGLPEIKEVAVMALPDSTWGQKVAAVIAWNGPEKSLLEFKELAKSRVAPYACPTVIRTLPELPRNHLGKVNKKELVKIFEK